MAGRPSPKRVGSQMKFNHASLFSGLGGFDLASQWMGWNNIFQVEKDGWCQGILAKQFPSTERYNDIKEFSGEKYRGSIDIISGGFPCQPFSQAGKQRGKEDDRYLWPEMLRVIREIQPTWIVGENVPGIISLALDQVYTDLENEGYTVQAFVIPACAVNAIHKRDRVWILAKGTGIVSNTTSEQSQSDVIGENRTTQQIQFGGGDCQKPKLSWPLSQPTICRGDDGVSYRLGDGRLITAKQRNNALKGLGNAVVPQLVYEIFRMVEKCNPAT